MLKNGLYFNYFIGFLLLLLTIQCSKNPLDDKTKEFSNIQLQIAVNENEARALKPGKIARMAIINLSLIHI